MSWTDITRAEHNRKSDRYPTDLTDAEWAVVSPLVPPSRTGGRPRTSDMREVMNAILYIAGGGIPWRMLPKDFPPVSTVRGYFYRWRNDGTLALMNFALVQVARELEGKESCPSAGIIDSQSVKTTESGGVCGYDAGKKTKGRKRHIVTDTNGLMVGLLVHSAAVQDRDGAVPTLQSIRRFYPFLRHIFADGGYSGDKLKQALTGNGDWTIEVVRRCDDQKGFKVLPRRWVVERTFAWLGRPRRLAKDWEKSIQSSTAWTLIAHIRILMRSPRMRGILIGLYGDWLWLDKRIEDVSGEIEEISRTEENCANVMTIPGIGPMISTAMVAAVGKGEAFDRGRDFAAWVGLVPRQFSTGGRTILGRITKRGSRYLRMLFVQAAKVIMMRPHRWSDFSFGSWLTEAVARMPRNKAAIALANKLARTAWSILRNGTRFDAPQDAAMEAI